MKPTTATLVMEGDFQSFTVSEVLQVVGLSRQLLRVVFKRGVETVGQIVIKAGRVLAIEARNAAKGLPALRQLLRIGPDRFEVIQVPPQPIAVRPLGTVLELLDRVQEAQNGAHAGEPVEPVLAEAVDSATLQQPAAPTAEAQPLSVEDLQASLESRASVFSMPGVDNFERAPSVLSRSQVMPAQNAMPFVAVEGRIASMESMIRDLTTSVRQLRPLSEPAVRSSSPPPALVDDRLIELLGRLVAAQQSSKAEWTVLLLVMLLQIVSLIVATVALGAFR